MQILSLNGTWKLKGNPQEGGNGETVAIDAQVPGCVQLDMSREGILPNDLFMGNNILEAEKYESWEWWYERKFTAPQERENVFLVLKGVDSIAEYYLNDVKIGDSDNMLIEHEFEIGKYLKDGENTIKIHITSSIIANYYRKYSVNSMISWGVGAAETGSRRAPHTFGWDIMPRAITAGLWRDVQIEVRDKLRFSQLFFDTSLNRLDIFYEIEGKYSDFNNIEFEAEGSCGSESTFYVKRPLKNNVGRITIGINNIKKWWPYGYGEPNIYDGFFRIYSGGKLIHEEKAHFGMRTVELDRTDVTNGINGKFRFLVNGVEIMCKGSNWVPLDAFHSRDAERYDKALELVKDIGCNILRCWGGNVYEDHKFFDFCDRNGIMIWQDFAMACRVYPQDDAFIDAIKKEATSVVRKLRNHPSIILWSGDNEIDQMVFSRKEPAKNILGREILPRVVELNDIGRPYLASSPYFSDELLKEIPMGASLPEDHLWGPRDYYKSDFYKQNKAHFVSETGYHGCPSLESIKKFITPEKVWPYQDNDEWILHSSDQNGHDSRVMLMDKQVRQLFGEVPTDAEKYIIASQISQAEAKKYFIERMRAGRPQKCGVIWWNLLDGWPQMSDAIVDYYFTKKVAYGFVKRAQAPFSIICNEINNWNVPFLACNDTLSDIKGHYTVKDAENGEIIIDSDFFAPKNTTVCIARKPVFYSDHKIFIIEWDIDGKHGVNHYLCGYPPFKLDHYIELMKKYNLM